MHEKLQLERSRGGKGGRSGSESCSLALRDLFSLPIETTFSVEAMGRKTAASRY